MAKKVESVEERIKRIFLIRDYVLEKIRKNEKISTRSIANYFNTNSYFNISNNTVDVYLKSLEKLDPNSYGLINKVLQENKPKTIADEETITRINRVVELLLEDHTVEEIANILDVSINTINKDINTRMIKVIDKKRLEEIKAKLVEHSMKNLKNQGITVNKKH